MKGRLSGGRATAAQGVLSHLHEPSLFLPHHTVINGNVFPMCDGAKRKIGEQASHARVSWFFRPLSGDSDSVGQSWGLRIHNTSIPGESRKFGQHGANQAHRSVNHFLPWSGRWGQEVTRKVHLQLRRVNLYPVQIPSSSCLLTKPSSLGTQWQLKNVAA